MSMVLLFYYRADRRFTDEAYFISERCLMVDYSKMLGFINIKVFPKLFSVL